jgi:protein-tyrosine phosphatase
MAEGALRTLLVERGIKNIEVASAGTAAPPGCPATHYAQEAVKTWHADISGHKSRMLAVEQIEEADIIFAMTPVHYRDIISMNPEAGIKTFLLKNFPDSSVDGEGIEDPIGGSLDMYNHTFLEIGEELGRILPEILGLAEKKEKSA